MIHTRASGHAGSGGLSGVKSGISAITEGAHQRFHRPKTSQRAVKVYWATSIEPLSNPAAQ
jgi:hypothetical protein